MAVQRTTSLTRSSSRPSWLALYAPSPALALTASSSIPGSHTAARPWNSGSSHGLATQVLSSSCDRAPLCGQLTVPQPHVRGSTPRCASRRAHLAWPHLTLPRLASPRRHKLASPRLALPGVDLPHLPMLTSPGYAWPHDLTSPCLFSSPFAYPHLTTSGMTRLSPLAAIGRTFSTRRLVRC